jgi:hypothetical protein
MRLFLLTLAVALGGISAFAEEDYYPLYVGNEWTYRRDYVDPKWTVHQTDEHLRICRTLEKDGKTYYIYERWFEDPTKKGETDYVRKDIQGIHSTYAEELAANGEGVFWLALPLKVGASWKSNEKTTCTVIALENLELEGKTYKNCYHVHSAAADGSLTMELWFAPNIGPVKSVDSFANGSKRTRTLTGFKFGS